MLTAEPLVAKARKHRDGTKEALLIDLLRRPKAPPSPRSSPPPAGRPTACAAPLPLAP